MCPKHRNVHREIPVATETSNRNGVCSLLLYIGAEHSCSAPSFCGCDEEIVVAGIPSESPAPTLLSNRTNFLVAHQRAAGSPKLRIVGQHHGDLPNGVVADKQCTCFASKVMWERYPPTPLIQLRETRPMHREKPHKLLQVGVTPTPATHSWEVIRLPDCKSGVTKTIAEVTTGALPALPTISDS